MNKQILECPLNNGLRENCFNGEPWRLLNHICHEYLDSNYRNDYNILFTNITDCSIIPYCFRFVVFDWQRLKILVYHEPKVIIYTFEDYNTALRLIDKSTDGFLKQGLTIQNHEEFKRIFLFKDLGKHKIKEITKGETTLKIGDFLSTCWGYDQTNVELFIIKKIIGKNYLILMEVAKEIINNDSPAYDNFKVSSTIRKIDIPIKAYISNDGHMSICEHGYKRGLSLTSIEESHYETAPGYGH